MEMTEQNTIGINKRSGKDRRDKSGFNIRSVLYLMAGFYLAVVVVELYLVSNVAYSLDHKLPPKILTTMDIFLL